jgi:hypothetical protein
MEENKKVEETIVKEEIVEEIKGEIQEECAAKKKNRRNLGKNIAIAVLSVLLAASVGFNIASVVGHHSHAAREGERMEQFQANGGQNSQMPQLPQGQMPGGQNSQMPGDKGMDGQNGQTQQAPENEKSKDQSSDKQDSTQDKTDDTEKSNDEGAGL